MASPTHMRRLIARILADSWVESVRCRSRAFSHPCCLQTSSNVSKSKCSALPWTRRLRAFTEHAGIKARISALQSQQVFPIDATANGTGRLPIGKLFQELEHGNQS